MNKIEKILKDTVNKLNVEDNEDSLKIPLSEKIHLIKDYEKMFIERSYNNPLSMLILDEGIVRSYPVETTVKYIQKYFGLSDKQIKTNDIKQKIYINIPNINNNANDLIKKMEFCGYYLSAPLEKEIDNNKNKWMWFNFEALHQEDNTNDIRNNFSILFHLTPKYNIGKIKHLGLSPRSRNTYLNFPHRIYFIYPDFANADDLEDEIKWIGEQLSVNNKSKGNNGEYCLLTIDLDKVDKNVKFFLDPNYEFGCYTQDYIKPEAIINIDYLNFRT